MLIAYSFSIKHLGTWDALISRIDTGPFREDQINKEEIIQVWSGLSHRKVQGAVETGQEEVIWKLKFEG